jgi:hypothetical protein
MILEEAHRFFDVVSFWLQSPSLKLSQPAIIITSLICESCLFKLTGEGQERLVGAKNDKRKSNPLVSYCRALHGEYIDEK